MGSTDFSIWQVKIRTLLLQQGVAEALDGEQDLTKDITEKKKENNFFQIPQCNHLKTAQHILKKLESVYMSKSLHRLYIKQKLYSFKIVDARSI